MASGAIRRSNARTDNQPDILLRAFDGLLASTIFIAPLFMGGRHPVGELVYVVVVSLAAATWAIRQAVWVRGSWRLTGLEFFLLAAVVIVGVQLVQLPLDLLGGVANLHHEKLPLWSASGEGALGTWSTISLYPSATRGMLVLLLAHVMLFLVVVQRLQSIDDVERATRAVALAVVVMACLGLAQFLFGNGKFLWVYEHPSRTTLGAVKGAFANENHLASFLALGLAPLVAWVAAITQNSMPTRNRRGADNRSAWQTRRQGSTDAVDWLAPALWVGLGAVSFAGLLTFSRGGVVVLALSGVVTVTLLAVAGAVGRRWMMSLAAAVVVVAGAMFLYGYEPLTRELGTLGSGNVEKIDHKHVRMNLWMADLEAVKRSPWLGTGAGSHAEVYPMFLANSHEREFTHAESSYVHILLETGVCGLLACLAILVGVVYFTTRVFWRAESQREKTLAAGILAALSASAIHAIWDFAWFLPACFTLVIILGACGCRLWQLHAAENSPGENAARGHVPMSSFAWAIGSVLIAGVGVLMIVNRFGPATAAGGWERFLALRRAESTAEDPIRGEALLPPLVETLHRDPDNARANLRMAAACMRVFEERQQQSDVPLPIAQIRDAVNVSGFRNLQEQNEWLDRVTGENRRWLDLALYHTYRALQLCPLQGEGYTLLAELSFLEGTGAVDGRKLLDQALAVRPHDAQVLFAVGRDAALAGDDQQAIAYWKDAFHRDKSCRRQIIALVGPRIEADEFVGHFHPTKRHLRELYRFYRGVQLHNSAVTIAGHLAPLTEAEAQAASGSQASKLWDEAHRYHEFRGDKPQALACIQMAAKMTPHDYAVRRSLARQLLVNNRFEEAIAELRWCRRQKRYDQTVDRLWAAASRGPVIEATDETATTESSDGSLR